MVGRFETVVTRQYDVCANPDRSTRRRVTFFLILQSDLLEPLETVVVAPVLPHAKDRTISRLNPLIAVDGKMFQVNVHHLSSVPRSRLGRKVSGANMSDRHLDFVAALDLLFTGI